MSIPFAGRLAVLAAAFAAAPLPAATSVTLPPWVCAHPDDVFGSRFDGAEAVPHDPSNGGGGAFPGKQTRTLHIAGLGSGTQNYYLYLPSDYTPTRAWPLLLALHGLTWQIGDTDAIQTRDSWVTAASLGHFIVAAPVADEVMQCWNGTRYVACQSWLVSLTTLPNDYDLFDAIRADVESAYNIERTRVYGWGFSAGGHVMHDLALSTHSAAFNASTMAAYSVSSGVLQGLACPGQTNAGCGPLLDALPRRIPVDMHIGNSDPNLPYVQADHTLFTSHGWVDGSTIHFTEFLGGHTYTAPQPSEIWGNLCPNAVVP